MKSILVIFLGFFSCAHSPNFSIEKEQQKLLEIDPTRIVSEMSALNYSELMVGKEIALNFDDGSAQIIMLDDVRSYAHAFRMPSKKSFKLIIQSLQTGSVVSANQRTVFYPILILLDNNFKEVTRFNELEFIYYSRGLRNDGMKAEVIINQGFLKAKYLIITTDVGTLGKSFTYFLNEGVQTRTLDRHTEINEYTEGTKYSIPYNHTGKVIIQAL